MKKQWNEILENFWKELLDEMELLCNNENFKLLNNKLLIAKSFSSIDGIITIKNYNFRDLYNKYQENYLFQSKKYFICNKLNY